MNAARAPGVASSAAASDSGVTPCAMPSSGSYSGGDPRRQPAGEHEPVDHRGVRVALHDDRRAERRQRQAERVVALRGAVGQKPRARGAVGLGREFLRALEGRRRLGPRSTPWMSCGMSSLSVCQPIAVRTPRSAPLPALWPGTWKRVEPRNPYATTASRYGAGGWSGEAMSAQACHGAFAGGGRATMPAVVLTREYVDVPVGERAMRTFVAAPAASGALARHRLLHRHLPAHRVAACAGRCGSRATGSWSPCPRSTTAIEPAGTVLGFDDAGKARGQADADAITTAEFDEDIAAAVAG